ncbi:MAG: hypothetical protein CMJ20_05770 [Phycisphaeraceae bacterium]|nr:hypothetical protein [Phycisphaeraceae bacterium]
MNPQPIPALLPHGKGHQFVFYGDCCSGAPGKRNERNFTEINTALRRMSPAPKFVVFLGNHIAGYESDPEALRRQWTYWHVECEWLEGVLAEHEHLCHKIVIGHHPVFPVNGYNEQPTVVRDRRGWRAVLVGAGAMRRVGLPLLAPHRVRCTGA